MIRILLADDQTLVRGALAAMLGLEADMEVVAEVGTGDEVLAAAQRTRPDVALLDVQMPGKDGLTAAAELHAALPSCRVVMCTTFGRPGYLSRALSAGASGFVVKDAPPEQLVEAVRRVHSGLRVVDPSLAAESLATGQSPLTIREREVLAESSDGGRSPTSPGRCTCPRGRSATTFRPPSAKQAPGLVPRPHGWLRNVAGCRPHRNCRWGLS
ncbi:hypothetical protein GCM10029964_021200 [Kibdelosporangium lantanae]